MEKNQQKILGIKFKKLFLIGIVVVGLFGMVGCSSGNKNSDENAKNTTSNSENSSSSKKESDRETIKTNTSNIVPGIEINKSEITNKAKFYPYEVDGTKMEILVLKAKDGTIRTAFNTCQVCYNSGKGYYVQEGNDLVCQNCGNKFSSNMVEKTKGGCNPVPIMDTNKIDDGNKIIIDKNFLDKNKDYFTNWKV